MSNIIIKTDQSGANDPIYIGQPRIFNFSIGSPYNVYQGEFEIKKGSSTVDDITAELYNAPDGPNGSGSVIASAFVSASSITTSFSVINFLINYSVTVGSYSLVLSSSTPSGGSTNYFIKNGSTIVTDELGNAIPFPTPTPTPTSTSTPTLTPSTPTECHFASNLILYYDPSNLSSYSGSGSTVYDLSGNNLDGNLSNVSYSNPYFTFNGSNSQIRILDNSLLEPSSGDWTMEAWVRLSANQTGIVLGKFDNGGASQDVSYSIRINSGGSVYAQMGDGTGSYVNSTFYQTTLNTWYQVIYVWKNGATKTLETYINGVSIGSVNHALSGLLNSSNDLYIGSYNNGEYSQYFNGRIGAIRLYNSALSSASITQNYNCGASFFFDFSPTPTPTQTPTLTPSSTTNQSNKNKLKNHGHKNLTNRSNERTGISLSNRFWKKTLYRSSLR